jgi:threonine/homoserine/homoserine lactone efflux protein
VESVRVGKTLAARASLSLVGLASLSYIGWLLFTAAQSTSKAGPRDHRDINTWIACTGLFFMAWLVSTILEYRLERAEKTGMVSHPRVDT